MHRVTNGYVCLSMCYVKGVNVLCIGCQSAMFGCQTAMHRVTIDYDCLSNCYVTGDKWLCLVVNLLCKGCQTTMFACQTAMYRVSNGYASCVKQLCNGCQSAMHRMSNSYATGDNLNLFFTKRLDYFFCNFAL